MKRLLTALAIVASGATAHAQTRVAAKAAPGPTDPQPYIPVEMRSSYTQLVDSLISPLDKSRIPTGILYDRVLPMMDLHRFTQYSTSSASHLFQSYFELYMAAYQLAAFPIERAGLRQAAEAEATAAKKPGGVLPIGVLDYRFNTLDTLAEDNGSIRNVNDLYYDGVGSPYLSNAVTIAAPLADSVYQTVTVTLPAQFQLQNTGRTLSYASMQVGWTQLNLVPGGKAALTFPSTGPQSITFQLYFSDGSTATARATVFVKGPAAAGVANRINVVELPWPSLVNGRSWRGYDGASTYGVGQVKSVIYHPLGQSDQKLRYPIVVMDGFDPSDKRDIDRIQRDFSQLAPALQVAGKERDLVILNFPVTDRYVERSGRQRLESVDGGADYIERNALVVVQLLTELKSRMADPTQKITIIAPSMGGLITRYALALMEKNYDDASNPATYQVAYWKHNVDTYMSFDGPHQGAVIPLGDQMFIDYFKGVSESAQRNLARLNSVAARQMLVEHQLDPSGQQFHIPFMRSLQNNGLPGSLGWPQQVRRVALANGSNMGQANAQAGQAGASGIQLDVARTRGASGRMFFYRSTTAGTQIAANMYFAPNANTLGTVFNGEATVLVSLVKPISKRTQHQIRTPYNSYDLAPGGTYDAQQQIVDGTLNGPQMDGYQYRFTNTRPYHCFIPTVSALAFQYRSVTGGYNGVTTLPDAYTNLSTRPLICNDETPFDAYYAYNGNAGHVTLDAPAQSWLVRELFNQTQPPTFQAGTASAVCLNASMTITLNDCSQRTGTVTYAWTLSGPGVFTSTGTTAASGTGISQEIRNTGTDGLITVSVVATRTGAAPSPAATYTVNASAGAPLAIAVQFEPGQVRVCPYQTVTVRATGQTSGPWYWQRQAYRGNVGGGTSYISYTTQVPTLTFQVQTTDLEVTVTAPSSCSGVNLPLGRFTVSPDRTNRCNPYSFRVSPVPSDGYLEINSLDETEPAALTAAMLQLPDEENPHAYQVELFNDRGRVQQLGTTRNGKVRLDTSTLPSGLYHVRLRRGGQTETRNIQITH
jgi:Putative serine esterase (DUF676)